MQQGRIWKKISLGIRILLMGACYFLAVRYSLSVRSAVRIVSVSLDGEGVQAAEARKICEEEREQEEALSLCFWREQEDMDLTCRETGSSVQVSGLFTEGNPELAAQGSAALAWQEEGCFLDNVTAEKLFGTRQANGQLVWCGGAAYTVYGTFESLRRTVVLRPQAGKEMSFNMVSVRTSGNTNLKAASEQFLIRSGLSGDTVDFTFPDMLSSNLLLLLPLFLAAGLVRLLWRCLRTESSAVKKVCCGLLIALAGGGVYFLLRSRLQIPADMIPTRWSDFAFWSDWWDAQRGNLLRMLGGAQGEMQLGMFWDFGLSVICDILALGFGLSVLHGGGE